MAHGNRALTFADADGLLHQTPVRTRFCIVDGIVAGEAEGPIYAKPVRCGAIIAGANPVRVDVTASELVGFDFARIPTMANAIKPHPLPLLAGQISETILVDAESTSTRPSPVTGRFKFLPPKGWAGHIEYAHRDK